MLFGKPVWFTVFNGPRGIAEHLVKNIVWGCLEATVWQVICGSSNSSSPAPAPAPPQASNLSQPPTGVISQGLLDFATQAANGTASCDKVVTPQIVGGAPSTTIRSNRYITGRLPDHPKLSL